jgi:MFS family permease
MAAFSLALDAPAHPGNAGGGASWAALLAALSVLAALAYVLLARRRRHPLFPLSILKQPNFSVCLIGNLVARIGCSAVPFLLPLLLQLQLNYSPLQSGLMMLPVALGGVVAKRAVTPLVQRFGYTTFLLANIAVVSLSIAGFAVIAQGWPLTVQALQLAVFGATNSLMYSAMNGVTLQDLGREYSGSGNSLFSMVQMLAMAIGVTLGGGLVEVFSAQWQNAPLAFRLSFLCIGLFTLTSALAFARLGPVKRVAPGSAAAGAPRAS